MATRGKNNKNNNRNYNDIIEEEQKKNNFVDVSPNSTSTNNFHEELNYFENKFMPNGKNKDKSFKLMYIEDYNYCLWLSEKIIFLIGDLCDFIEFVKKYRTEPKKKIEKFF